MVAAIIGDVQILMDATVDLPADHECHALRRNHAILSEEVDVGQEHAGSVVGNGTAI